MTHCALIMAGGTGGHIFPGLALADELKLRGWRVHWLGNAEHMEGRLVPARGYPLESVQFGGVRGKGLTTWLRLPGRLLKACKQSSLILRRVQPDVVIGLGGYITFPAGVVAAIGGYPLMLHEQNSVAGMANRWLRLLARKVFSAFPQTLKHAQWVGNPLRAAFTGQPDPAQRFASRHGPLRLLVVGGSLGARALNDIVPRALALMEPAQRPQVIHQSGTAHIDALKKHYADLQVQAEVTAFIEDTAQAFAQADLIICRAGASTVTEIAAVGAAAVFVPFPAAVDDHQTRNARYLTEHEAGLLMPQKDMSPEKLAALLRQLDRTQLQTWALKAKTLARLDASQQMANACEELAK
jgi:UDP-N-acetylglucosamine--N-acetylmuramyl-(pentapeptide) pyrophosphoryl-undecaprenol N-acetylglucosamine transferase